MLFENSRFAKEFLLSKNWEIYRRGGACSRRFAWFLLFQAAGHKAPHYKTQCPSVKFFPCIKFFERGAGRTFYKKVLPAFI